VNIVIVGPAPAGSRSGNRVTALRWARTLRRLGHRVRLRAAPEPCDLLVALHAKKSARAVLEWHEASPQTPIVVALTGTDLYPNLERDALPAVDAATRIITLQPLAQEHLPGRLRARVRVIYQSASPPQPLPQPAADRFDVCVIAHLRDVKDPLRAAEAAAQLPAQSKIQIALIGAALDPAYESRIAHTKARTSRFVWRGELTRRRTLLELSASRLLVSSSLAEGGANVIGEAIACEVPVLATRIPGSVGLLGDDYPGLFEPGDTLSLAVLMRRAEVYPDFLRTLQRRCAALRPLFEPREEEKRWKALLAEL
jgi:putative glycosyltransferase (TIGR04348 family)